MNKYVKYIFASAALAGAISLGGCHSNKATYKGNLKTEQSSETDIQALFDNLADSYADWTDVYVPVNISLTSPKNFSVSGRATMVRDKEINISLRLLGMEVAVIYINTEKAYVVDKYHKMYICEDLDKLLGGYDITIADLQNLLLGRVPVMGQGEITSADFSHFEFLESGDDWILTPKKQIKGSELHYIASKTTPPVLTSATVRITGKGSVAAVMSEHTDTPAGPVAGVVTLVAPLKDKEMEASVIWELDDAKWNQDRTIKFKTPSEGYKKIDIEQLLKSF